ncbi:MAG TPA: hypothetical protein VN541_12805 [Tepidisphaeraceae bacterium]|nr:hypothetical protein [Tepidisphaeraceae bacterium]
MSDVPQETISLAAEVEVLRLVVVELVRRLPREDRTAIEALVQQLATTAEDLSVLPTSGQGRRRAAASSECRRPAVPGFVAALAQAQDRYGEGLLGS